MGIGVSLAAFIFCLASIIAFLASAAIIATRPWHAHITGRRESKAAQQLHEGQIPRLGGCAIFIAGLFCLSLLSLDMSDASARLLWSMWACLAMVAGIGLYEDLRRTLPPLLRYFGTATAALLFAMANGGIGIHAVDLPLLDTLLAWPAAGLLFFVFAVTGTTHAFNLIDGQHGLCAGISALAYAGIAIVAARTGQSDLALLALALAGANCGFLLLNYPRGLLFLGDCGAYFNGATIGVMLVVVAAHPAVSPWFALTLIAYPVWETLYTMLRRHRAGQPLFEADAQHLHHLLFYRDRLRRSWLRHSSAPRLIAFAALPMTGAILAYAHSHALMLVSACFAVGYVLLYGRYQAELDSASA